MGQELMPVLTQSTDRRHSHKTQWQIATNFHQASGYLPATKHLLLYHIFCQYQIILLEKVAHRVIHYMTDNEMAMSQTRDKIGQKP